jgi:hypothetical protein
MAARGGRKALLASATTLQTPLGMAESSSSRSMALRTVVLLAWAIAFDRARALEAGGGHASFHRKFKSPTKVLGDYQIVMINKALKDF